MQKNIALINASIVNMIIFTFCKSHFPHISILRLSLNIVNDIWGKHVAFLRKDCAILEEMYSKLWRFLPTSRKARLILAVLAVGTGLFVIKFLFFRPAGRLAPADEGLVLKLHQEQLEKLREDGDGDGLKNWEEVLYQTDAANPDTDGDGTSDGEEIKQDRDPVIKGPDDHFATSTPLDTRVKDPETNYTRDFTRNFLRGPISQIVAGGKPTVDIKAVERYADTLSKRSVLADAPRFTMADIHTSPITDEVAIVQYLTSFDKIFKTIGARGKNEVDIVAEVFQTQGYGGLADLDTYPDVYQKAINDLGAISAPKNLAEFHLSVLNYLSQFKRSVEFFQKTESDPLLAMLAFKERFVLNDEFSAYLNHSKDDIVAQLKKKE